MPKAINFMRYRKLCLILFLFLALGFGVAYWFKKGFNYSVDFTGGTQLQLKFEKPVSGEKIKNLLNDAGWKGVDIRVFSPTQLLVRLQSEVELKVLQKQVDDILSKSTDSGFSILKVDSVSPRIGKTLRADSIKAIIISLLMMLVYISIRFKSSFAIGAVMALVHDTLVICLFFLLTGWEISTDVIAAIIMILGYSINDTIVIFSRIRENLNSIKDRSLVDIVNISLNETLRRTILTSLSTALVVIPLIIGGSETLRGLSLATLIGIIFGTYSSIFVASPVMIMLDRSKKEAKENLAQ
jgi:preprotein translocase subunit SecF